MRRSWLCFVLAACIGAPGGRLALGQLESPLLSKVQANLVNPGGKSLALGGAFVSLADDTTALYANPAGLGQQAASSTAGLSGKVFRFEPRFTEVLFSNEVPDGAQGGTTRVSREATELDFAAVVVPITSKLAIGAYRAITLRYQMDADDLGGTYSAVVVEDTNGAVSSLTERGSFDIRNAAYGLSANRRIQHVHTSTRSFPY